MGSKNTPTPASPRPGAGAPFPLQGRGRGLGPLYFNSLSAAACRVSSFLQNAKRAQPRPSDLFSG